jgi:hypothetical protein
MTIQEINALIAAALPSLNGFSTISGTTWDINAYPKGEKVLSANTALTLSGVVNGKSSGILAVSGAGFTLTINSVPVTLKPSGITAVSVFVEQDGTLVIESSANLGINTQTASYTATLADNNSLVRMNVGSANTFTVPPNSSVAFPVGAQILVSQTGAGQTTITPGAGVTINSAGAALKTRVQYSTITLIKTVADVWLCAGDITT